MRGKTMRIKERLLLPTDRKFTTDAKGTIAVIFAMAAIPICMAASIALDMANASQMKSAMQAAADAAVLAAASSAVVGANQDEEEELAIATFEANLSDVFKEYVGTPETSIEFTDSGIRLTASINAPTLLSTLAADYVGIEVTAMADGSAGGDACVLGLDKAKSGTVISAGSNVITMPDCVIAANSTSDSAIKLQGSTTVNVQSLHTAGNYTVIGGAADLTFAKAPTVNGSEVKDPFENTAIPSLGTCDGTSTGWNNGNSANRTVNPGPDGIMYFCQGLSISGGDINFKPGTYVIDRGDLTINGNGKVRCSSCSPGGPGVVFIFTATAGANVGKLSIAGTPNIVLNAPSSGTYKGLLFYQDAKATTTQASSVRGDSTSNMTGAFYFPSTSLDFAGNSGGLSECVEVVANTITFTGNSTLTTTKCEDYGFDTASTSSNITLVE
jgi:Flp pilus assembly protein TadG